MQPGITWALYENLPGDGHTYFAANLSSGADLERSADEAPVFGEIDPELINQLFQPHQARLPNAEATIAPYLRDGKRAADDDDPENVWLKVRFLEAHTEDVDIEAALDAVTGSETYYDRGRANVPAVKRGAPAEFKVGDVAVFRQDEEIQQLLDGGVAELVERVYVRPLVNYELAFRKLWEESNRFAGRHSRDSTRQPGDYGY